MNIETLFIGMTFLIAYWGFSLKVKQDRFGKLSEYLKEMSGLRKVVSDIEIKYKDDQQKLKKEVFSVVKEKINFIEIMCYGILEGYVNERDWYIMVKDDLVQYYNVGKTLKADMGKFTNYRKLLNRWDSWGLDLYYAKLFLKNVALIIIGIVLISILIKL